MKEIKTNKLIAVLLFNFKVNSMFCIKFKVFKVLFVASNVAKFSSTCAFVQYSLKQNQQCTKLIRR